MAPKSSENPIINSAPGFFGTYIDHEAPIVICDCISFIRNQGLYDTGVFRIPGSSETVTRLKESYNMAFKDKHAKETSPRSILNEADPPVTVHDTASLLKSFLTTLSEPLVPPDIVKEMFKFQGKGGSPDGEAEFLSRMVKSIPSPNRECFGFLVSFMREICSFKRFNQMDASGLSTMFALSLLGSPKDVQDQLMYVTLGPNVLKKLITGKVHLYMPSVQDVQKNTKYKSPRDPQMAEEAKGAGVEPVVASRNARNEALRKKQSKGAKKRSNELKPQKTSREYDTHRPRKASGKIKGKKETYNSKKIEKMKKRGKTSGAKYNKTGNKSKLRLANVKRPVSDPSVRKRSKSRQRVVEDAFPDPSRPPMSKMRKNSKIELWENEF